MGARHAGLFNIIGSLAVGWAMGRWRMKSLLSLIYAARAVAVLVFLLAPKTGTVVLVFAAVMGLTYPLHGAADGGPGHEVLRPVEHGDAVRRGDAHAPGGRLRRSWMGGKVFERTGSYDWVWYVDIVLAVARRARAPADPEAPLASRGCRRAPDTAALGPAVIRADRSARVRPRAHARRPCATASSSA
jgi:hypothetical protein